MGSATHEGATAHRLKNLKPDMKLKTGGPVAERVAQLLSDPVLKLGDIAETVVREGVGRSTTARSVASIAASLRRDGYRVPDRRHRAH